MTKWLILGIVILECFALNPFPGENWKTGYIQVKKDAFLFYYHFKVRDTTIVNPPLVIWLEGGPGTSSALGVFSEGGPYIVNNKTNEIERNPFAWNEVADTLFVDQPAGTLFSYSNNENTICTNMACVADDFYTFLVGFYDRFPEYKGRDLYISGVSYGGHYVPGIAGKLLKENNPDFVLKGIAIGNGLVDLKIQLPSYPVFLYENGLINWFNYIGFKTSVLLCRAAAEYISLEGYDWNCSYSFFQKYLDYGIKVDMYDISETTSIYGVYRNVIIPYLNLQEVQEALGVDRKYENMNMTVFEKMRGDWSTSLTSDIELVLERGLKVFLYFGDKDYVVNYISGEYLADSFQWAGRSDFLKSSYVDWIVNGIKLAQHRTAKNLSLIRVYNTGHTIFYKQRNFALDMLKHLLS